MENQPLPKALLSVKEVAHYLAVSPSMVWTLARTDSRFPHSLKITEKRTVWKLSELEKYVNNL